MRLIIIFLPLSLALIAYTCKKNSSEDSQAMIKVNSQNATGMDTIIAAVDFQKDIQPILKSRCSPCHFPGGKMHLKMPFDSARTIINHPEGILRRIKDPEESRKITDFVAQANKQ